MASSILKLFFIIFPFCIAAFYLINICSCIGADPGVHREQVNLLSKKIMQKDRDTPIEQSL